MRAASASLPAPSYSNDLGLNTATRKVSVQKGVIGRGRPLFKVECKPLSAHWSNGTSYFILSQVKRFCCTESNLLDGSYLRLTLTKTKGFDNFFIIKFFNKITTSNGKFSRLSSLFFTMGNLILPQFVSN